MKIYEEMKKDLPQQIQFVLNVFFIKHLEHWAAVSNINTLLVHSLLRYRQFYSCMKHYSATSDSDSACVCVCVCVVCVMI
jgi:hypothetical protein